MKMRKRVLSALTVLTLISSIFTSINAFAEKNVPTIKTSLEGFKNEADTTFSLIISYETNDFELDAANWYEYGMTLFKAYVPFPEGYGEYYTGTGRGGAISFTASDFGNLATLNANFDTTDNTFKVDHAWTPNITSGGTLNYSNTAKVIVPIKILKPFETSFTFEPTEGKVEALEINPDGSTAKHWFYQNQTDIDYATSTLGVAAKKVTTSAEAKIVIAAPEQDDITDKNIIVEGDFGEGKTLVWIATVLNKADLLNKKVSLVKKVNNEEVDRQDSDRTLADILGGITAEGTTVEGSLEIGVLATDYESGTVFEFELR